MNSRIAILQKHLRSEAALIESPVDLFYLTGLQMSKGLLAVTANEAVLYVDGRYFSKATKEAPCTVRLLDSESPARFLRDNEIRRVDFDSAATSYDRFENLKKMAEGIEFSPMSGLLKLHRGVKDGEEIAALKRAADLTWRGYRHIAGMLTEGIAEEELALEFEMFVRKHGASGLSFEPIIAFGENSAYPHHRAGKTRLEKDQVVLMDIGAVVDSYRGDLTRVHFFGRANPEIERMLQLTKRAQQAAIDQIRPGAKLGDVDRAAREVFRSEGVEELFSHGLGHGIGLETHEFPSFKAGSGDQDLELKVGMVFTVEPGLYRPGLGGVRWEDMVQVIERGVEKLFHG